MHGREPGHSLNEPALRQQPARLIHDRDVVVVLGPVVPLNSIVPILPFSTFPGHCGGGRNWLRSNG